MSKVQLTEEQSTMLITLYGRALDSRAEHPVLGDRAAAEAVDRIGYDFGRFDVGPDTVMAVAARARVIDRWAAQFLADHPDAVVLHLGCGMDARVFRLDPPSTVTWYDIDYPEVIDLSRAVYPTRDNYQTIGAPVTPTTWVGDIPSDRPTLVVAEGLTMYLHPDQGRDLLRAIVAEFPGGQLICDTYSRLAIELQHLNPVVSSAGATIRWGVDDPAEFARYGLRLVSTLDGTEWPTAPEWIEPLTTDAPAVARPPLLADGTGPEIRKTARISRWDF